MELTRTQLVSISIHKAIYQSAVICIWMGNRFDKIIFGLYVCLVKQIVHAKIRFVRLSRCFD